MAKSSEKIWVSIVVTPNNGSKAQRSRHWFNSKAEANKLLKEVRRIFNGKCAVQATWN